MVRKRDIQFHGDQIMGHGRHHDAKDFNAFFGIPPDVILYLWWLCGFKYDSNITIERLLWALMFLKIYATYPVLSALAGVSTKTYQKWVWYVVCSIAAAFDDIVSSSNG